MTRKEALVILADLPDPILDAMALVIKETEPYCYHYSDSFGSMEEDNVRDVLYNLADEIRNLE